MLRAMGNSSLSEEGGYATKVEERPDEYARNVVLHPALWDLCKEFTEKNGLPNNSELIRDAVWDLVKELKKISTVLDEFEGDTRMHISSFYAPPPLRKEIVPYIKGEQRTIFRGLSEMVRFAVIRWLLDHRDELKGEPKGTIEKTHYSLSAQEIQLIILRQCIRHKFVSAEQIAREIAGQFGVDQTQVVYEKWIKEIKRRVHPNLRLLEKQEMVKKYSRYFFESKVFCPREQSP